MPSLRVFRGFVALKKGVVIAVFLIEAFGKQIEGGVCKKTSI